MALLNLGFETMGASAGFASSWTLTTLVSTDEIASYNTPAEPRENFEKGWGNDDFKSAFGSGDLLGATYNGLAQDGIESFETGWILTLTL